MTRSLIVRPAAEKDLYSARDWYDHQQLGLGIDFLNEVSAAMTQLQSNPELASPYYRNFRRFLLHRFPYKLFYQVLENRIVVFRVLHAKQAHRPKLD